MKQDDNDPRMTPPRRDRRNDEADRVPFWDQKKEESSQRSNASGQRYTPAPEQRFSSRQEPSSRNDPPSRRSEPYGNNRRDQRGPTRRSSGPEGPQNTPVWKLIVADALVLAVCLVTFALVYYILPLGGSKKTGKVLPTITASAQTTVSANQSQTAQGTTTAAQGQNSSQPNAPVSLGGLFGSKFADKFNADGTVNKTDTSYKSGNVNLTLKKVQNNGVTYFTVDIYVRDIKYFKTAFANGTFGKGSTDTTLKISEANKALAAISGDFCSIHNTGIVIRNGELFRDSISDEDVLIMYQDGSMETYSKGDVDLNAITARGAYQSWAFGPMLLDASGKPMTKFNSNVSRANPRSALGYYEPGHYVFLLVDGRQSGYSDGMTMADMSQLFYDMGCKVAYNLDGGQTSVMTYNGAVANQPYNGGRSVSDIVYITDEG